MDAEREDKTTWQRILRFTRDRIWEFVSVVIAIAALLVSLYAVHLQLPNKQLRVTVLSSASLVTVRPEVASEIIVIYKGREAERVGLVQVRIENTGNQEILEADYKLPISFSFNPAAEIADIEIIESEPPSIGMSIAVTAPHQAEIAPVLLMRGEWVDVRFILVGDESMGNLSEFEVDGRISGVKIDVVSSFEPSKQLSAAGNIVTGMMCMMLLTLVSMAVGRRLPVWFRVSALIVALILFADFMLMLVFTRILYS